MIKLENKIHKSESASHRQKSSKKYFYILQIVFHKTAFIFKSQNIFSDEYCIKSIENNKYNHPE